MARNKMKEKLAKGTHALTTIPLAGRHSKQVIRFFNKEHIQTDTYYQSDYK